MELKPRGTNGCPFRRNTLPERVMPTMDAGAGAAVTLISRTMPATMPARASRGHAETGPPALRKATIPPLVSASILCRCSADKRSGLPGGGNAAWRRVLQQPHRVGRGDDGTGGGHDLRAQKTVRRSIHGLCNRPAAKLARGVGPDQRRVRGEHVLPGVVHSALHDLESAAGGQS